MPLTDTAIKNFKPTEKPVKKSDGGGLFLLINPNGSKLWRLAYRFDGKQKLLALGGYPAVPLADARRQRDAAKALLARGNDPGQVAKDEKAARVAATENTFSAIADELLAKQKREGRAVATLDKKRWLLDFAVADLGGRPIAEITAAEILVTLRRIEKRGRLESARRLRGTVGEVFRYAIATTRAETDPTLALRGALTSPTVTHRAALTTAKGFGGLLRAIWNYDGMPETRIALQVMAFLYPRPGELRQAEWTEFDLDKAEWTIPASRMKMRREHKKPLPPMVIELLEELQTLTGDGRYAFPSVRSRQRVMSENTLNASLRRMGFTADEASAHGFRASASSLLNESGKWSPDAIEAELAHMEADEVRKAYHRTVYWEERVKMAAWWQDEIERLRVGNVVTLKKAR